MTFALGTPHRGQTIAPDDDRFAIEKLPQHLRPHTSWEDPPKVLLRRKIPPQLRQQLFHILGERRFEPHVTPRDRMHHAKPPRM